MTQHRLVKVVWEDASIADDGTWVSKDGLQKPEAIVFESVGWLMELDASCVVLSACMGRALIAPRDRIPIGMVRSITEFDPSAGTAVAIPKKRRARKS